MNRPAPLSLPDIVAASTYLPIDVTPPTVEEIRMANRQINRVRATGPDNIPPEALNSDCKYASRSIQEDLGGRTSATDRLKRRTLHQNIDERRPR